MSTADKLDIPQGLYKSRVDSYIFLKDELKVYLNCSVVFGKYDGFLYYFAFDLKNVSDAKDLDLLFECCEAKNVFTLDNLYSKLFKIKVYDGQVKQIFKVTYEETR